MADQEALFGTRAPPRGRTRRGIDDEITAARANGDRLPGSKVALLRTLADRLDHLDRLLASHRASNPEKLLEAMSSLAVSIKSHLHQPTSRQ